MLALLQPKIARRHVSIERIVAPDLKEIPGDRIQLQQVFVNLITNALDSLAQIRYRKRIIRISIEAAENAIVINVRDNGTGLAQDMRGTLFESFVTNKPGGMGMGLSICRTIVEAHGGTLSAHDVEPCGAEFRILLPHSGEVQ